MADELARIVIQVESASAKAATTNLDGLTRATAAAEGEVTALGTASAAAGGKTRALAAILASIEQSSKSSAAALGAIHTQQIATSASTEQATAEFRALVASIAELIGVSKGSSAALAMLTEREAATVRTSAAATTGLDALTQATRKSGVAATEAARGAAALSTADQIAATNAQRAIALAVARADAIKRVAVASKAAQPTTAAAPPLAGAPTLRDSIAANEKAGAASSALQSGLAAVTSAAAAENAALRALSAEQIALAAATDAATAAQLKQTSALRAGIEAASRSASTQANNARLRTIAPPTTTAADMAQARTAAVINMVTRPAPPIGPKPSEVAAQVAAVENARRGFAALADAEARVGAALNLARATTQVEGLTAVSGPAIAATTGVGAAMRTASADATTLAASLRAEIVAQQAVFAAQDPTSRGYSIQAQKLSELRTQLAAVERAQTQATLATTAGTKAATAASAVPRATASAPRITDRDITQAVSAKSLVALKELQRQNDLAIDSQFRLLKATKAGSAEFAAQEAVWKSSTATGKKLEAAIAGLNEKVLASKINASGANGAIAQLQEGFGKTDGIVGKLAKSLGLLVIASFAKRLIGEALELADAYQQVANKVKLFSTSPANADALLSSLVKIAQESRAPLDSVVSAFTKITASAGELGASQADVLKVTKAIGQTFVLSGSSAQQATASANEFARAISEGGFNSRELKVIFGDNLALAQALAAGLGVSVGKLREMAAAGELTSQRSFKALVNQADAIAKRAESVGPTLSGGTEVFKVGLEAAIGRLDTMLGLSRGIGEVFESLGRTLAKFNDFRVPDSLLQFGASINRTVRITDQLLSGHPLTALRTLAKQDDEERFSSEQLAARKANAAARDAFLTREPIEPKPGLFASPFADSVLRGLPTPAAAAAPFAFDKQADEFSRAISEALAKNAQDAVDAGKVAIDRAKKAAGALIDLRLRTLGAQEDTPANQLAQFTAKQRRELGDALDEYGKGSAVVTQLITTQAAELNALAKRLRDNRFDAIVSSNQDTTGVRSDKQFADKFVLGTSADKSRDAINKLVADGAKADSAIRERLQALATGLQNTLATGIEGLFTKGLKGIDAFWSNFKITGIRVLSELAASRLLASLFGTLKGGSSGGTGGGASLIGTLTGVVSSLFGAVKKTGSDLKPAPFIDGTGALVTKSTAALGAGVSTAISSTVRKLIPTSQAQPAMGSGVFGTVGVLADLFKSSTTKVSGSVDKLANIASGAKGTAPGGSALGPGIAIAGLGFGLGNVLGQQLGGAKGAAAGALAGAASGAIIGSVVPVVGTVIGGIIGGAAGLIGGLFGGAKKKKAQQELARQASDALDSLTVRALAAAGDDFAANKKRLELEQKAELDAAIKQFGAASEVVRKLREVQAAEAKKLADGGDGSLAAGTYLAPAGFDITPYRFDAGRPAYTPSQPRDSGMTLTGNTINIVVPDGTAREQAEEIVRHLQDIAGSQGYSPNQWSAAVIQ